MLTPLQATILTLSALGIDERTPAFVLQPPHAKFKFERDDGTPLCREDGKPFADSRGRWYMRDAKGTIRRVAPPAAGQP